MCFCKYKDSRVRENMRKEIKIRDIMLLATVFSIIIVELFRFKQYHIRHTFMVNPLRKSSKKCNWKLSKTFPTSVIFHLTLMRYITFILLYLILVKHIILEHRAVLASSWLQRKKLNLQYLVLMSPSSP